MGAEENELTLVGLAHKLEALQRKNAENAQRLETLERENAELRREVTAPRGPGMRHSEPDEPRSLVPRLARERVPGFEGPLSRRALLGKAGAAMAAGMLLNPREARADIFDSVNTHSVYAEADVRRNGVWARAASWASRRPRVTPASPACTRARATASSGTGGA